MKKILLYLALTIAFITGVGLYTKNSNLNLNINQNIVSEQKEEEVKSVIDFGDGNVVSYSDKEFEGKTAYDLLKKTADENNIEVKVKEYDFGVFVEEIGGKISTNDLAWIFFINGRSATEASDQYLLKAGDLIEWKYIKPEF